MKFLILESTEGGMDEGIVERAGVMSYLRRHDTWWRYRDRFIAHRWKVGEWMQYPCGLVVCVRSDEPVR